MKKQLIAAAAVASIGTAGIAGVSLVGAATQTTTQTDPFSSLVDKIASKFNLSKAEVQKVFDEQKTAMDQERETQVKSQVAQLVKDGKLTQAQADKINAKRAELQKQRESERASMQNKTDDERRTTKQQHRTEIDTWLKDNDIDTQYSYLLKSGRGHGPGGRDGMSKMMRSSQDQAAQDSSSNSSTSSN